MITHCKKCDTELPEPIPENVIGNMVGFCTQCREDHLTEEENRRRFVVPGQSGPYVP